MFRFLLLSVFSFVAAAQPSATSHVVSGPSLPSGCSPQTGDVWFKTGDNVGLYNCTATNTWTLTSNIAGAGPTFNNSRTISGCPVFPDSTIFNTRLDNAPVDLFGTQYYFGKNYVVTGGSWAANVATLTIATGTDGLAVGEKVFVVNVNGGGTSYLADGFNTGYGGNKSSGSQQGPFDPRVTITTMDSTHISYALVGDPGAYVSGGNVSLGPYGGTRLGNAPSFGLNTALSTDVAYQMAQFGPPPASFANTITTASDNAQYVLSNNSIFEGWPGDGTFRRLGDAQAVYYPSADAHLITLLTDICQLQELYGMRGTGPPFYAQNGSVWNLRTADMRTARLTTNDTNGLNSNDAAGLPVYPFVLTRSQVLGTDPIKGPARFTLKTTQNLYVWPATHFASSNTSYFYPPMGMIARLKSNYDKTTCQNGENAGQPFPAYMQKVLTGFQQYGIIMADNGTAGLLDTTADFTTAENTAFVGWLHCVYLESFESVNTNAMRASATSFNVSSFTPVTPTSYVPVTVTTTPNNLTVNIDQSTCTSPCQFLWKSGEVHTIGVLSQSGGAGTQYAFGSWSDSGTASHSVSTTVTTTYTATMNTQFLLTTATAGATGGGSISPVSGYYNSGSSVSVTATANTNFVFSGFSGGLTGTTNPQSVTVSAPTTVTANFVAASGTWYDTAWSNRKPITIDHTQVSADLTNFPVLISLATDSDLAGKAQSTGNDILFTSSDKVTKLNHAVEIYTTATGKLIAWVQVPTVATASDTVIYMYYGNATATAQGAGTAVWDTNYKAVWHLKDGTTLDFTDATSSGITCTNHSATATTGEIDGGAAMVSASSQFISCGTSTTLSPSNITVSAWANGTTFPTFAWVASRDVNAASSYSIGIKSTGKLNVTVHDSANTTVAYDGTGATTLTTGTWNYYAFTYTAGGNLVGYANGAVDNTVAATANGLNGGALTFDIGNSTTFGSRLWNGAIDEVRVSSVARPAAWILAEYNNQKPSSTFFTLGAQQIQ